MELCPNSILFHSAHLIVVDQHVLQHLYGLLQFDGDELGFGELRLCVGDLLRHTVGIALQIGDALLEIGKDLGQVRQLLLNLCGVKSKLVCNSECIHVFCVNNCCYFSTRSTLSLAT